MSYHIYLIGYRLTFKAAWQLADINVLVSY